MGKFVFGIHQCSFHQMSENALGSHRFIWPLASIPTVHHSYVEQSSKTWTFLVSFNLSLRWFCSLFPRLNRAGAACNLLHPSLPAALIVWKECPLRHLLLQRNHHSFSVIIYITFNYIVNVLSCLGPMGLVHPQMCRDMDHHAESVWIHKLLVTRSLQQQKIKFYFTLVMFAACNFNLRWYYDITVMQAANIDSQKIPNIHEV